MSSRRVEQISKIVLRTVGNVIQNQLSDPRIQGMVSVTRVELAPDFRTGRIYLSVLGCDEKKQKLAVDAISHASGYIQSHLAKVLTIRQCPILSFVLDDSLKTGYRINKLIDEVAAERQEKENRDSAEEAGSEELSDEGQQ